MLHTSYAEAAHNRRLSRESRAIRAHEIRCDAFRNRREENEGAAGGRASAARPASRPDSGPPGLENEGAGQESGCEVAPRPHAAMLFWGL
jgi:hypothetical protein